MKYIKKFETTKNDFKIGDIVTVLDDVRNFYRKQTGEIVSYPKENGVAYVDYEITFNYNSKGPIYFMRNDIRQATAEEIEKYKLEKNINKYNL